MENTDSNPHAVLLSSPGIGHLTAILELGKRLVTRHNFEITLFVVSPYRSTAESQVLRSAIVMTPKILEIVELPPPDISELVSPDAAVVTQICVIMREIRPALRSAISALPFCPAALIVDLFGTEAMAAADEFEVPKYVYVTSNAWFLSLYIYSPVLDKLVEGEYVDKKEPLKIPGCRPIRPDEVVDPMLDRTDKQYLEYIRMGVETPMCNGILSNTWLDLEPATLEALRDETLLGGIVKAPVYAIGPLVNRTEQVGSKNELFLWLDKQPSESVMFVSFGSGGTLCFEQMTELAWGIEQSQQRFIWVVRMPTLTTGDGSYFTGEHGEGGGSNMIPSYLPEGFLNRTRGTGMAVPNWAPQMELLSHPSVGGFLTHCGWNSILESITNGVPMIAWPLYAEQRMNATLLREELGVAVGPKALPSKGVVGREEIEMMIRRIMVDQEGTEIRNRARELKCSGEKALSEGGSSFNALSLVGKECEMSWKCQKEIKVNY